MNNRIRDLFSPPVRLILKILGGIALLISLYSATDSYLVENARLWLTEGLENSGKLGVSLAKGNYLYSEIFTLIIIAIFYILIFSIIMSIYFVFIYVTQNGNEYRKYRKDHDFITANTNKFINQFYGENIPPLDFTKIYYNCFVEANGDSRVTQKITFRAIDDKAHFWTFWIDADDDSPAVDSISELKLFVKSEGPNSDVAVIPLSNDGRKKRIAIFFIPGIPPNEERTIEIEFQWPGFMNQLRKQNSSDFYWGFKAVGRQETDVCVRIYLDKAFGQVNCQNIGAHIAPRFLKRVQWGEKGIYWEYANPAENIANKEFRFRLETTN